MRTGSIVGVLITAIFTLGVCTANAQQQPPKQDPPKQETPKQEAPKQGEPQKEQKEPEQKKDAAAADPISGDWDGLVGMPEGTMPFSMALKLDKDNKVTGSVGSDQGSAPLTDGSFSNGTLTASFVYMTGDTVSMSASLKDDQLIGTFTTASMTLSWGAKKRAK